MAEFQDVMREYVRCRKTKHLDEPLLPWTPSQMTDTAIKDMEKAVQEWSKANPVPEYPTWLEWLAEQGVLEHAPYGITALRAAFKPIPDEIASKMGIKPKTKK